MSGKDYVRRTTCAIAIFVIGLAHIGCKPAGLSNESIWNNVPNSAPPSPTASWRIVGPAGFAPSNVAYTSMAIDPRTGVPYVTFEDGANGAWASVMSFQNGNWNYIGSPGFSSPTPSQANRIAIDSNGVIYVAFQDGTYSQIIVWRYVPPGPGWTLIGNLDTAAAGSGVALALDRNDVPYVAYREALQDRVKVQNWVSGAWAQVGASTQYRFNTGPSSISLAVDSMNNPWVSYEEGSGNRASVMRYDSTSWVPAGLGPGSASTGSVNATSLALDASDRPYLACWDMAFGGFGLAVVKTLVGSQWVDVGNPGFSVGSPQSISIALSPGGIPYVGYVDGYPSGKATVMVLSGTTWVPVGSAGFSSGTVQATSLALDAQGSPYLAFMDHNAGDRPTVMAFK